MKLTKPLTVNDGSEDECIYLIELKYAAKKDATEAKIESLKKEAAEQVQTCKTALEFKDKQVKAYAMVFAGSECVYCGLLFELLQILQQLNRTF